MDKVPKKPRDQGLFSILEVFVYEFLSCKSSKVRKTLMGNMRIELTLIHYIQTFIQNLLIIQKILLDD